MRSYAVMHGCATNLRLIWTCCLLAALAPCALLAQEGDEAGEQAVPEDAIVETVNVTADFVGDSFSPDSVSTAVLELSDAPTARTAVEAAVTLPGVAENGQAGIFQVLSVRGVSRQRLLSFVDGVRITSERRAGVSASFIDPGLLGQLEVARGPASTYYGSGALGGALQLFPKTHDAFSLEVGYSTRGDEKHQVLGWGNKRLSLGLAHRQAGDAETPDGERLFSRFEQTSISARQRFGGDQRRHDVLVIGSYGEDIGKSSLEFPERITTYPRERHGLVRYSLESGSAWRARLWTHAQDLITDAVRPARAQRNTVENQAYDLGGLFEHRLPVASERLDGRLGVDYFGRRDVSSEELAVRNGDASSFRSLQGAEVDEFAGYSVINWSIGESRFEVGARLTEGRQRSQEERRSRTAVTGFLGAAVPLSSNVTLVGNVGRGLRFPSLTEQFFVGTTGRGSVRGNPDLSEETSTSVELALRVLGRRGGWSVAAYRNRIDDYIERVELDPGLLGFVNLTSGRILGAEFDAFIVIAPRAGNDGSVWRFDLSGHWIDGESNLGASLSDIPAARVRAAASWRRGRWSSNVSLEARDDKDDFGPSERAIASALLLDAGVGFDLTDAIRVQFELGNALDEEYFPSADDRAPLAPGRAVGLRLVWKR